MNRERLQQGIRRFCLSKVKYALPIIAVVIVAFPAMGAQAYATDSTILFEDHFDTTELSSEWVSIKPSHWVQDGWLYSQDTGPGRDAYALVHESDQSWMDYTYSVLAEGVPSMGGAVDAVYILFRMSNISWGEYNLFGRYYQLAYYQPNGNLTLRRNRSLDGVDGNLDRDFLFIGEGVAPNTGPVEFRITVRGARIQVWIDDVKAIDVIDPEPLLYGGIGIGSLWESVAKYDDVLVSEVEAVSHIDLTSLPDINGNGTPELAALRTLPDGIPEVVIKDSDTKELINELWLPQATEGAPTGLTDLLDINGNGTPEVAVLMVLPSGQGLVKIKDGDTGAWIGQIRFFGSEWQAKAITSQDLDLDGISEISVLAVRKDGTRSAIQIKDSLSGELLNWIELPMD